MTKFFREELITEGCQVISVSQGAQVLSEAQSENPDVILIHDYFIEGTVGAIPLCIELRHHLKPDLPIILISFVSNKDEASKLGVQWFDFIDGIEKSIERIKEYLD